MMADTTLLTLLQELLETYDDTIDTGDGSAIRTKVIDPFLRRIGDSPLDVDLESFLVARLGEEYPELDTSTYSGIRDLCIRAMVVMLAPLRREINAVKNSKSLDNAETMTRDEVNALLANFFTALDDGTVSGGSVRVYFSFPQSCVVTPLTKCATGSGLNFFPTATQSVSSSVMSFSQEDGLYYFEFSVEAEEAGTDYNVASGAINSIVGIPGAVRVSNPYAMSAGVDAETKAEGVTRAKESITIRNLSVSRGIKFLISEEFEFADTVQVIGRGDDEMERDIVNGPVTISGVPDAAFMGASNTTLYVGQHIHIGGKTDVYVYQEDLVDDTLDIKNVTDVGTRVYAGNSGYTESDASGSVTEFKDLYGNFYLNGVRAGDYLRLGTVVPNVEVGDAGLVEVTAVPIGGTTITLADSIPSALYAQTYEVVRFSTNSRYMYVPLYDLVAEDEDGEPVLDADDAPVQATPGDPSKAALYDGDDLVAKEENIATNNLSLPLVWVGSVEKLDPISLEATGNEFPLADVVRIEVGEGGLTGGTSGTKATGTARVFFRDAVSCAFPSATSFWYGSVYYNGPGVVVSGSAEIQDDELRLVGDVAAVVGYRVTYHSVEYTILTVGAFSGVYTPITVREEFLLAGTEDPEPEGVTRPFHIRFGVLQADMETDDDSGLAYADVTITAVTYGADGNLAEGTVLSSSGIYAEGWFIRAVHDVHSFSMRELPYLVVTPWLWIAEDSEWWHVAAVSESSCLRLNYKTASYISGVQDYVDDDDNRVVAEDVLVRHFAPALVRGSFTVDSDLDTDDGKDALVTYINTLDPTEDLEVSDLVGELRDAGATYTMMPLTLTVLQHRGTRRWDAEVVQDRVTSSRIQHFIADEDHLTVESE